jgi:hypothetical protein
MSRGKPIGLQFLDVGEFWSFNKGRDVTYHIGITRDFSEFTMQAFKFHGFLGRCDLASGDICRT